MWLYILDLCLKFRFALVDAATVFSLVKKINRALTQEKVIKCIKHFNWKV